MAGPFIVITPDEATVQEVAQHLQPLELQPLLHFRTLQEWIRYEQNTETAPAALILLALALPDSEGLDAFAEVKLRAIQTPVIALLRREEAMLGIHLLQMGAADYLFRDELCALLLQHVVARALERQKLQNALSEYLQELYASESRFRAILRHYPDGLLVLDEAGRVLLANSEACRLLMLAETELVGQSIEALFRVSEPGFVVVEALQGLRKLRMQEIACEEDGCRLVLLREPTPAEQGVGVSAGLFTMPA
ncbi:hypothetical protein HRbin18_00743 [bacterium HR18]|uniref:PAS domain-containing protein n=1 Tax=Rhodothermus marinus TaxID=29549 RepID=A0A7V2F891_RHOMR|nr:hypothetical protein HRbin18_00743 [bacterium HR18]